MSLKKPKVETQDPSSPIAVTKIDVLMEKIMVRNSSKKLLKEKSTIDEPSIRKESDLPTNWVAEVSPPRFRS